MESKIVLALKIIYDKQQIEKQIHHYRDITLCFCYERQLMSIGSPQIQQQICDKQVSITNNLRMGLCPNNSKTQEEKVDYLQEARNDVNSRLELFKKQYAPIVGNSKRIVSTQKELLVKKNDKKGIQEMTNQLNANNWGEAGELTKKNIMSEVENLFAHSTTVFSTRNGKNVVATKENGLMRIVWFVYTKEIPQNKKADISNGETSIVMLTYFFESYQFPKKDWTKQELKSLLLGSGLDEEQREKYFKLLMTDLGNVQ